VLPEGGPQLVQDESQFFSLGRECFGTETLYLCIYMGRSPQTAMMQNYDPKGLQGECRKTNTVAAFVKNVDPVEKRRFPLEEVSKLLGHESNKTTERHYSKWMKGRQDRLVSLVVGTWRKK